MSLLGIGRAGREGDGQRNGACFTMSRTGTFTYHCTIHPSMVGTIVVQ